MKKITLFFCLVFLFTAGFAAEAKKLQLINEFLVVSDARGTLEKLRLDNVAQTRAAFLQQVGDQISNPLMVRLVDRVMQKYAEYSKEFMGWSNFEPRYIAIYNDFFSEAELEGIVAFYKTDSGKALIRAQPEIGKRMQQQMFQSSKEGGDRIDLIMKETVEEIRREVEKEQAAQPAPPAK